MAETNVIERLRALPAKIEGRLAELAQMDEFDQADIAHCRATYWSARDDWHKILVDCYHIALQRQRGGRQTAATAPASPERRTSSTQDRRAAP